MFIMSTDIGIDCYLHFINENTEVKGLNNLFKNHRAYKTKGQDLNPGLLFSTAHFFPKSHCIL